MFTIRLPVLSVALLAAGALALFIAPALAKYPHCPNCWANPSLEFDCSADPQETLTVTVVVNDAFGVPIVDYPAEEVCVDCGGIPLIADAPTSADGFTTVSGTIQEFLDAGCCDSLVVVIKLGGSPICTLGVGEPPSAPLVPPELTLVDPQAGYNFFGFSLAAATGHLLVTALRDSVDGVRQAGTAYLFDREDGDLLHEIENPDPDVQDDFGVSVSEGGGNLVVGAWADDSNGISDAGTVYRFDARDGSLLQTIPNPDPAPQDRFGNVVLAYEGGFAVGVPRDDPGGLSGAGSVYLYDSAGSFIQHVPDPGGTAGDSFGGRLALVSGILAVSAAADDPGGVENAGSVYRLDPRTGEVLLKIPNPDPDPGDRFGGPIGELDGDLLALARFDDSGPGHPGTIYRLDSGGQVVLEIHNPAPDGRDESFGESVAGVEGWIAVGARTYDHGAYHATGAFYVFDGTSGALDRLIPNPAPAIGTRFGLVAAAENGFLVSGEWVAHLFPTPSATGVRGDPLDPARRLLLTVAPNPLSSRTSVRYSIPRRTEVDLSIFDVRGRRVARLVDGIRDAGWHEVAWSRGSTHRRLAAGVYLVSLRSGAEVTTRKVVLLN